MPSLACTGSSEVTKLIENLSALPASTPSADTSLPSQAPATVDDEKKRTMAILIAHAPENASSLKNMLFLLNALKYQLCSKGQKWANLDIDVQPYDVTRDLSGITDTAKSDNPLQPYQLIILLLSLEFVAQPFCYSEQMKAVFEDPQVERRLLCIPLRECPLKGYPFSLLPRSCYLPGNQRPVGVGNVKHKAYMEIANGIEKAVDDLKIRL